MRFVACLAALLMACASLAAADGAPTFRAAADTVRADGSMSLNVELRLNNPLGVGLYSDSLYLTSEDHDPGESGQPRVVTQALEAMVHIMTPVEAHAEASFTYACPAPFDHGHFTFRLLAHDANKTPYVLTTAVVVDGGVLADNFPSQILKVGGRTVEVVLVPAQGATGPAPGVLFVPGDGTNARHQIRQALQLSARGDNAAVVSLPGHGLSQGPDDAAGPATLAAVGAALDALAHASGTDPKRLAIYGQGSGATAALLVAEQRQDLSAVIAQNASYDLWASYRGAPPERRAAIVAAAGRDSAAWRARSPMLGSQRPSGALLVIQNDDDPAAPLAPAKAFAERYDVAGARVEMKFPKPPARAVPSSEMNRAASEFLARHFAP